MQQGRRFKITKNKHSRAALECLDFANLGRISAACVVAQIQPNIHQCPSGRCGNHILPHAQHLRVIVFYRAAHTHQIVRRGRADAAHFVGSNRRADARAANQKGLT